jgi:hypothetical protein
MIAMMVVPKIFESCEVMLITRYGNEYELFKNTRKCG